MVDTCRPLALNIYWGRNPFHPSNGSSRQTMLPWLEQVKWCSSLVWEKGSPHSQCHLDERTLLQPIMIFHCLVYHIPYTLPYTSICIQWFSFLVEELWDPKFDFSSNSHVHGIFQFKSCFHLKVAWIINFLYITHHRKVNHSWFLFSLSSRWFPLDHFTYLNIFNGVLGLFLGSSSFESVWSPWLGPPISMSYECWFELSIL